MSGSDDGHQSVKNDQRQYDDGKKRFVSGFHSVYDYFQWMDY